MVVNSIEAFHEVKILHALHSTEFSGCMGATLTMPWRSATAFSESDERLSQERLRAKAITYAALLEQKQKQAVIYF